MIDLSTPCVPSVNKPNPTHGYALRVIDGRRVYEHVFAWEEWHGERVPAGMVIDHVCHDPDTCPSPGKDCPHRRCRNPLHLQLTTRGENAARAYSIEAARTHCPQSHPYSLDNTYVDPRGRRHCRTCQRRWQREHKERRRAAA